MGKAVGVAVGTGGAAIAPAVAGAVREYLNRPEPGILSKVANMAVNSPLGAAAGYLSTMAPGEAKDGGVIDRWRNLGLEAPSQGIYGILGALSGEDGARIAQQPVDMTAEEFGNWILNRTKSPLAATAGHTAASLWGPF